VVREVLAGTRPFDDPAVVAGGRMLAELLDRGCIDRGQAAALDGGQMQAAFWRGAAAMTVVPQGSMIDARLDGTDTSHFGSFPMPSANGRPAVPTAGLAVSWVVNDSTRSLSAVQAWVRWLASEEYLELSAKHGRTLVPAQRVPAGVQLDAGIRDALGKVAQGTGFNPSVYLQEGAKQAWYDAVQGLVTGRMTPERAMAGVRDAIEEAR
jgi:raffinose/stachyose/melibiose transport system substrate-binding protein